MIVTFKIPGKQFFAVDVPFTNPYSEVVITPVTFSYSAVCDKNSIDFESPFTGSLSFTKETISDAAFASSSTIVG